MGIDVSDYVEAVFARVYDVCEYLDNDPLKAHLALRSIKPKIRIIEPQNGYVTRHYCIVIADYYAQSPRDDAWIEVRIIGELNHPCPSSGDMCRPISAIMQFRYNHEEWETDEHMMSRALRFARCFDYSAAQLPSR